MACSVSADRLWTFVSAMPASTLASRSGSKDSCPKKSRSSEYRCPSWSASPVPPARIQPSVTPSFTTALTVVQPASLRTRGCIRPPGRGARSCASARPRRAAPGLRPPPHCRSNGARPAPAPDPQHEHPLQHPAGMLLQIRGVQLLVPEQRQPAGGRGVRRTGPRRRSASAPRPAAPRDRRRARPRCARACRSRNRPHPASYRCRLGALVPARPATSSRVRPRSTRSARIWALIGA